MGRNSKDKRQPEIFAAATKLKKELGYKKVGAIGFCYGGWGVFRLAAKGKLSVVLLACRKMQWVAACPIAL